MAPYALWGGPVLLALVWACCWLSARQRNDLRSLAAVVLTGVATVLALGINLAVGAAVDRPRPFLTLPHVLLLLPHSADGSFPSDHAVIAGAFAGGLVAAHRRWAALAAVVALLLAFSRVYVGVHYPTDVAAGLLIGAAVGILLTLPPLRSALARLLAALVRTPLRPLLQASPTTPSAAHPLVRTGGAPAATPGSDQTPVGL